ncbi:MAG: hypothetical protein U5K99_04125 [Anaerolineales bacterium]|nr:hypothetical protein [Anaerolineales bacterium]
MKKNIILNLLLGILLTIIVGCSQAAPPQPTAHPGESILNNKCVQCHDISRVKNYQSDREGWAMTVDRMVLLGVELSDEQYEHLVDYLALKYPLD